jgi:hypothetical protein
MTLQRLGERLDDFVAAVEEIARAVDRIATAFAVFVDQQLEDDR